jgi:GxxExxY protein
MSLLYSEESYKIRGACFKVWKEFGGAFKESIVDKALTIELEEKGFKVEEQKRINIYYHGEKVGTYVPDKVVNEIIIIELKSKPFLSNGDIKQFWHYLKGTEYKLGFLINFGNKLEIKRVVYDSARSQSASTSA